MLPRYTVYVVYFLIIDVLKGATEPLIVQLIGDRPLSVVHRYIYMYMYIFVFHDRTFSLNIPFIERVM